MDLKEKMEKLSLKYNIDSIGLFGSRARGDFQEYSDYDVFIIGDIDMNTELKIEAELEDILNGAVDLVRLTKALDKILLKNILNDAQVFINNNYAFEEIYNFVDEFFKENYDFLWYREQDLIYG